MRESFRGYSNKAMSAAGPGPWSALCSLSLLIFEEFEPARGGPMPSPLSHISASHEM